MAGLSLEPLREVTTERRYRELQVVMLGKVVNRSDWEVVDAPRGSSLGGDTLLDSGTYALVPDLWGTYVLRREALGTDETEYLSVRFSAAEPDGTLVTENVGVPYFGLVEAGSGDRLTLYALGLDMGIPGDDWASLASPPAVEARGYSSDGRSWSLVDAVRVLIGEQGSGGVERERGAFARIRDVGGEEHLIISKDSRSRSPSDPATYDPWWGPDPGFPVRGWPWPAEFVSGTAPLYHADAFDGYEVEVHDELVERWADSVPLGRSFGRDDVLTIERSRIVMAYQADKHSRAVGQPASASSPYSEVSGNTIRIVHAKIMDGPAGVVVAPFEAPEDCEVTDGVGDVVSLRELTDSDICNATPQSSPPLYEPCERPPDWADTTSGSSDICEYRGSCSPFGDLCAVVSNDTPWFVPEVVYPFGEPHLRLLVHHQESPGESYSRDAVESWRRPVGGGEDEWVWEGVLFTLEELEAAARESGTLGAFDRFCAQGDQTAVVSRALPGDDTDGISDGWGEDGLGRLRVFPGVDAWFGWWEPSASMSVERRRRYRDWRSNFNLTYALHAADPNATVSAIDGGSFNLAEVMDTFGIDVADFDCRYCLQDPSSEEFLLDLSYDTSTAQVSIALQDPTLSPDESTFDTDFAGPCRGMIGLAGWGNELEDFFASSPDEDVSLSADLLADAFSRLCRFACSGGVIPWVGPSRG